MRKFIVLSSLCIYSLSIYAEPTSKAIRDEITDNISTEYAECGAYFSVVFGAFEKSGNKEAAEKYKSASDNAMQFALISAQESRSKEMAMKVTLARFQQSIDDMQRMIVHNYSNISLLSSKYSETCIESMANSEELMQKWTEKITSKYKNEHHTAPSN